MNGDDSRLVLRATPRILSIAGTDPTGGAGIHADLKSIAANGGYGMAVITALVAQNTCGVRSVHTPPAAFLRQQLHAVSDDVTIDAVKIGMLADVEVISEVRSWLEACRPPLVVLDPVMVATSGDRLLAPSAEQALRDLVPLVDLVTPNLPELAVLLAEPLAPNWAEAIEQGKRLSSSTGVTVLVKGGHLTEAHCPDALVNTHGLLPTDVVEFHSPRILTHNTHGTGCSLSSAIATVQARTGDWIESLAEVKDWLQDALAHADELEVGAGNGPIHHFHRLFAATTTPTATATATPTPTAAATAAPTPTAAAAAAAAANQSFTEVLWRDIDVIRLAIFELPFVTALGSGALAEEEFSYYLAQDALYLSVYARVLERASALAPDEDSRVFLAQSAVQCAEVETELHRNWLGDHHAPGPPSPATENYLAHLLTVAEGGNYAVLLAAILPCFWLYSAVGDQLHADFLARSDDEFHPYSAWLETYADEGFATASRKAIDLTEEAAANASAEDRAAMRMAFSTSSRCELEFFDAPRLLAGARYAAS